MIIKTVATIFGVNIPVNLQFDYQEKQDGGNFVEPIQESVSFNGLFTEMDFKKIRELNNAALEYIRDLRAEEKL